MNGNGTQGLVSPAADRHLEPITFQYLFKAKQDMRIILNHQDLRLRHEPKHRKFQPNAKQKLCPLAGERNRQFKTTAATFPGEIGHFAAVCAGDLPGQRKPKAGTLDTATEGIMSTIKLLENL